MTDGDMSISFLIRGLISTQLCWLNGVISAHIQIESADLDILSEELSSKCKRIPMGNFASGPGLFDEKDECFQVTAKGCGSCVLDWM